jgi:amino acid adenylation domain-containing protein/non-ribosomal peptide synthase protein (TIGR01720 family)
MLAPQTRIAELWGTTGDNQPVRALLAAAAAVDPGALAFTGPQGPVEIGGLAQRVESTAAVLAASGVGGDAAVTAAIAPLFASPGAPQADTAARVAEVVAQIRASAAAVLGSSDWSTVPGIFKSVVHRSGDRTAITAPDGATITYAELDERSDALARGLVAAGAGPERLVGVAVDRSADAIVALLAVVKTGAAYLPLDRSHPLTRLSRVVTDADPAVIIVDDELATLWSDLPATRRTVADLVALGAATPTAALPAVVDPRHPAYVMYTSGSTGAPKGVVVPHEAVVDLLAALDHDYLPSPDDVWVTFTSFAFDVSVAEIWMSLVSGGRLVVVDRDTARSPLEFARVLYGEGVTMVNMTPSAFYQFAAALRTRDDVVLAPSLRAMILAGEALDFEQVRRWHADRRAEGVEGPQLNNMYGPTETTVYVTRRELTPEFVAATHSSDIGQAIDGVRAQILDSRLRPVPDGVPGDLYISGDQVTRGYAGMFGLTATRFVADPSGPAGARMYFTGDAAMYRAGSIEYLGRGDGQVKLRGFRIELGEVEAALLAVPGVHAAGATVRQRRDGIDWLVGYVVADDGIELQTADVRAAAARRVPDYMVPDVVVTLDRLPLNVNGKLDRLALPDPVVQAAAEYVAPAPGLETELAAIFADVVGIDRISATESLFDVGGNSLIAAQVAARCGEDLDIPVAVRDIFEAPTVAALAARVGGRAHEHRPRLVAGERPARIPLSAAQRRIWLIAQLDPMTPMYNIPLVLRFGEKLDPVVLDKALAAVIERHEVLRTRFITDEDGQPYQQVLEPGGYALDVDVAQPQPVSADGLSEAIADVVGVGFDLAAAPPLRARLLLDEDGSYVLVFIVHHVIGDGGSLAPLARDLVVAYSALAEGHEPGWTPLPVQYADFAHWQQNLLGDPADATSVAARQLRFWTDTLAGAPELLALPTDFPRPPMQTQRAQAFRFEVARETVAAIDAFARRNDASLFMTLHAISAVVLARMTGERDIVIGTPYAGRGERELDDLVGMFVNTVALRTEIDPAAGFADLLSMVREVDLSALDNAEVPFEMVVDAVNPARSTAHSPIFQVLLVLQEAQGATFELGETRGELVELFRDLTDNDLALTFVQDPLGESGAGPLIGVIEYNADLFVESTIESIAEAFGRVADGVLRDETRPVGDIEILDGYEREAVLLVGRGAQVDFDEQHLADAVQVQIAANPDAAALAFEGRTVSYAEFGARVAVLARELIAAGIGPDDPVAVCLSRSVEMVVALHAVIAAGGQYVPIDPDAPAERVESMLDTVGARVLAVRAGDELTSAAHLAATRGLTVAVVDCSTPADLTAQPVTPAERRTPLRPDHAAYTLFTSGSTGVPKGVTVSHRAVYNRLRWGLDEIPWGPDDVVVQKTPYTFDVSVPELFGPLLVGARLVVARPGGHTDPQYLAELLEQQAVTSVHFVPSMLAVFLDVIDPARLARLTTLRYLPMSGEAVPPALARRAAQLLRAKMFNLYGPTEAAVEVTYHRIGAAAASVPMGRPVWNTTVLVLDSRLHPVPQGVAGELYLAGVQLARGYAARGDLTADRFVADPFGEPGARMYRTGDLVRYNASDELEYLGRTDFQVKLRGQRIELGEVESILASLPGVVHAAATVATAPTGAEHLVAYVAGHDDIDVEAARESVAQALPEYMVPTVWQVLTDVILNSAGKLDRRALPEPDFAAASAGARVAPESAAEARIAEIVAGILGVESVGVTDSFFALGGDSIMSIQLSTVLRGAGYELSPRDIFEYRTVRALAAHVGSTVAVRLDELPGGGVGAVDLTPTIRWMLELSPRPGAFDDYNQSTVLNLPAGFSDEDVAAVLDAVIARHPMLSARLAHIDGRWTMSAGEPVSPIAERAVTQNVDAMVGSAVFNEAMSAAHRAALAAIDPATGVMVGVATVRNTTDGAGRLVLAINHIAVDAVSWMTILGDLAAGAAALATGETIALPPPTGTSMRRWARVLAELGAQRRDEVDLWRRHLPEQPSALAMSEPVLVAQTAQAQIRVPAQVTEAVLGEVAPAFRTGADDVLLTAVMIAAARLDSSTSGSGAATVSALLEGHGRVESIAPGADLSSTVGWFTSVSPVSVGTAELAADLVHATKSVKEALASRPDDGIAFGSLRWGPDADDELAARPLPPIVFNYLGAGGSSSGDAVDLSAMPFAVTGDGPELPPSVAGAMLAPALTANISTVASGEGREFLIALSGAGPLLDEDGLIALGESITEVLAELAGAVAQGDPGFSPSDIVGVELTQDEIDLLARERPGAQIWPLSPLQQGLLFQSELSAQVPGGVDAYLMQSAVDLRGDIDEARLRVAAQRLTDRHQVLRSSFVRTASGQAVAVVEPAVDVAWETVDLRAETDIEAARTRVRDIAEQQTRTRLDLARPPLIRFTFVRLPDDSSTLIITNHHLLADGWSTPLMMAELFAGYGGIDVTTPAPSYRSFLDWVARSDAAAGQQAWREFLAAVTGPTLFAANRRGDTGGASVDHRETLGPDLTAALSRVSRELEVTSAVLLQFAWAVLLHKLTGEDTVVFGETVSGRPPELDGADAMIGLLINTLPVAVTFDDDLPIADALADLAARKATVLDHQHLSLTDIAKAAGLGELFDTLVVYESYPVDAEGLAAAGDQLGVEVTDVRAADATHYPLTLVAAPAARDGHAELDVTLKYLPELFGEGDVAALAQRYRRILEALAADPTIAVGDVSVLDAGERAQLVPVVSGPAEAPALLADLLTAAAVEAPDTVAVVDGDGVELTYRELDELSNRLARWLIGRGMGAEDLVVLLIPRSAALYAAVWGVAKSGAGYVSVDPAYPEQRVADMLADCGAGIALTADGVDAPTGLFAWENIGGVALRADIAEMSGAPVTAADRVRPVGVDNTAYVIYTSGSTGRPKGVEVSHRGLANFAAAECAVLEVARGARVLGFASPSFDASVLEYLMAVAVRGTIAYRPADAVGGAPLQEWMVAQRVQHGFLTPSVLASLDPAELPDVVSLAAGGEAVPASLVAQWAPHVRLQNLYGPTETTIGVTISAPMTDSVGPVVLGPPIAGIALVVLDDRLQPVPFGVAGELYVAGPGVSRGYLDRSGLTAERFVAYPYGVAGERMYRTGDVVRWVRRVDGTPVVDYVGRSDDQVKLRGLRIELGEVQAVLAGVPGVSSAVVVGVDEAGGIAGSGVGVIAALAGYLVPEDGAVLNLDVVRAAVAAKLPGYMVPAALAVLDRLPLTPVGKLDTAALPAPVLAAIGEFIAPESDAEVVVAEVFAEVLGLDQVGVTDSFFDLGGNSLSATRLAARVGDALQTDITIRDVFDGPTVRDLAAHSGGGPRRAPLVARERPERIPLSSVQRRMWFINQFDPSSPAYNITISVRLRGDVEIARLRAALGDVLDRHEILRTRYPSTDLSGPRQEVLSAEQAVGLLDWVQADSFAALTAAAVRPFDVSTELPIRAYWYDNTGEGTTDLLIIAHHIAFDGGSGPLFVRDLIAAYAQTGQPALPVQYADYAMWQLAELGDTDDPDSPLGRQFAYWLSQLEDLPAVTDLPMDRPRPVEADPTGARIRFPISPETTAGLAELAREHGVTTFMLHHALVAVLVARLAATTDVVLGTPIDGRTDAALHELIGMFVNTLVLRTPVAAGMSVAELLGEVRRVDIDAFANADVSFEQLVQTLAPDRSLSHSPLFQIILAVNTVDTENAELAAAGIVAEPLPVDVDEEKVDLTFTVVLGDDPHIDVSYATALFDAATVERFGEVWQRIATAAIADPAIAVGDIDIVGSASAPVPAAVSSAAVPSAAVSSAAAPPDRTVAPAGGTTETGTLVDILAHRDLDPTHPALICGDEQLTYAEFEARSNRVARALIDRGVGPEVVVAIGIRRSIDFVIAVWGVIKSGGAYVPVDPAYPAERVGFMLEDSEALLGITAGDELGGAVDWLSLSELESAPVDDGPIRDEERLGSVTLTTLAYLIYTSGSTGKPKAVAVSNSGLADLVATTQAITGSRYDDPDTRVLAVASPSFDASVYELLCALTAGHTLVIAPPDDYAGTALDAVIEAGEITDMMVTPSVLASLDPARAETVRNLSPAGEACPPELVERWATRGRRVFNSYGPTEATVLSTRARLLPGKPITIGRGVVGFTTRVLDTRLHEVPPGVLGELYVEAAGLARGYVGRPGLTATSFIANPFGAPGSRLYKTGDIVRVNSAGDIEFGGRSDHQIKINGQRVELGEIQAVLGEQPGVAQAVVIGVGDKSTTRLVGYLVAEPGIDADELDTAAITADAAERLPRHMVPAQLIAVPELPLTPTGKLDRDALPKPGESSEEEFVAPATDAERALADIVSGLLGLDEVSVTESFFALGGDSIMSIQLASAAKSIGISLTPRETFEHRTVRAMALAGEQESSTPLLAEPDDGAAGDVPLPPIVAWMVELSDGPSDYADFSQAVVLAAPRDFGRPELDAVLAGVVGNHPALASVLDQDFTTASLRAGAVEAAEAAWTDARSTGDVLVGTPAFDEVIRVAHADALAHLNPTIGLLIAAVLLRDANGDGRVVLAIHHLGVDAVSWPILIEDLATAWSQLREGAPLQLRPETTSMRAWFTAVAAEAPERSGEVEYWLGRLPETPTPLASMSPEGGR